MLKSVIIGLLCFGFTAFGPDDIPDVNVEAMFLYQFTKYVDWPANMKDGDFVIGIYGPSKVEYKLRTISQTKKVGSQNIKVLTMNDEDDLDQCNILFVPASQSYNLPYIIGKIGYKPVLIVCEKKGLTKKGAGISFFISEGKVRLEINKQNIENKKLKIAGELLKLAS